jgi:hypothetical protein
MQSNILSISSGLLVQLVFLNLHGSLERLDRTNQVYAYFRMIGLRSLRHTERLFSERTGRRQTGNRTHDQIALVALKYGPDQTRDRQHHNAKKWYSRQNDRSLDRPSNESRTLGRLCAQRDAPRARTPVPTSTLNARRGPSRSRQSPNQYPSPAT